MSAAKQPGPLDLAEVRAGLELAGWDALAGDLAGEVAARRDHPPSGDVWAIVVDQAGRFKFTSTCQLAWPLAAQLEKDGRSYDLTVEKTQVMTIRGWLRSPQDVPAQLRALAELAQVAGEEAEQGMLWTGRDLSGFSPVP